jgi:hypothetical protein
MASQSRLRIKTWLNFSAPRYRTLVVYMTSGRRSTSRHLATWRLDNSSKSKYAHAQVSNHCFPSSPHYRDDGAHAPDRLLVAVADQGSSTMRTYCKAYLLGDLRQFSGWAELVEAGQAALADDAICFLWDDFTVQAHSPFSEQGYIIEWVTPKWLEFCRDTLGFAVPDDARDVSEDTGDLEAP